MNDWWTVSDLDEAKRKVCASPEFDTVTQTDLDRLLRDIPVQPDWKILEVGCGIGRLMRPLREQVARVDGVDASASMIACAETYLKDVPNGIVLTNDGKTLHSFPSNFYDFTFAFTVFQHIRSHMVVMSYLNEMYRVLKPGGFLRYQMHDTSDPAFGRWEENPTTVWGNAYTRDEVGELAVFASFSEVMVEEEPPWQWVTARKR